MANNVKSAENIGGFFIFPLTFEDRCDKVDVM